MQRASNFMNVPMPFGSKFSARRNLDGFSIDAKALYLPFRAGHPPRSARRSCWKRKTLTLKEAEALVAWAVNGNVFQMQTWFVFALPFARISAVCVAGARSILHMTSGSIVAKIYDANIVVTE